MPHDNSKPPKGSLPAFTPVPRLAHRSNGWKPEVQRAFIEALAETGSVEAASRRVNRAAVGAYALRRHPEGHEFRKAWEAALEIGVQKIEDVAMDRALNGVEVPVYSYGKLLGNRTVYNDRLLMFILRNRAPKRFAANGARGMSAVDQATLRRMRKQWRAEWEAERAAQEHEDDDEQEILDSLDAFLGDMHKRRFENMSPRTRAAWEEYQRIEAEERAKPYWEQFPDDDTDADDDGDDAAPGPGNAAAPAQITDASGPARGPDSAAGDGKAHPADGPAPPPGSPPCRPQSANRGSSR